MVFIFNENINKLFVLKNSQYEGYGGTCKNKDPLKINTTLKHNITCCSLEDIHNEVDKIDKIQLADKLIYGTLTNKLIQLKLKIVMPVRFQFIQ